MGLLKIISLIFLRSFLPELQPWTKLPARFEGSLVWLSYSYGSIMAPYGYGTTHHYHGVDEEGLNYRYQSGLIASPSTLANEGKDAPTLFSNLPLISEDLSKSLFISAAIWS